MGRAATAFVQATEKRVLTNGDRKALETKIKTGAAAAIEAGDLELFARIAGTTSNRLKRIAEGEKMPKNQNVLIKIANAVDIYQDPEKLNTWKQSNPVDIGAPIAVCL